MPRFFVEPYQIEEASHRIHITGGDVNHIKNVLRMQRGEELWVSGGGEKEYFCTIEEASENEILCHIQYAQTPSYELPGKIVLFQCLPKGDKMEWIIQKAVELGASEIVPVAARRCVVRLDVKKAEKKVSRWQQIAEGAAKQSRRMKVPKIHSVQSFQDALLLWEGLDVKLFPYELAQGMANTREVFAKIQRGNTIGIFIGPEGGFEEEEVQAALAKGAQVITLGKRILRTETAGLAVLSVLMFQLEEE